jgi:predicted dehydrogenase
MNKQLGRRDFIKTAAAIGAGLAVGSVAKVNAQPSQPPPPPMRKSLIGFTAPPMEKVRLAFAGTGGRGTALLREFLKCDGTVVNAVCDPKRDRAQRAKDIVEKADRGKPEMYTQGEHDYERLCQRDDIDLVINATPWEWHVPIALATMNSGKHAGVEVPAALTVEDCWKLVDTAEATQRHCMVLENCCYGPSELALLNAVRQRVFGEILHGEGGYLHDLQKVKFDENGEGAWRRKYSEKYNGNLYPTHGLGPIANCMDINRGDRFGYLVSMSGPSRGLQMYAAEKFGPDDPRAQTDYKLGDVNTSLIQTARGKTLMVQHDTNTSRPYSRINSIVGTKGIFCGYPDRVGIGEKWGDIDAFFKKYEHPLVTKTREGAKTGGHGGMDFIMAYRLVTCLQKGLPLDMTVYDAAAWSCIVELSIKSVANKSAAMDFPDFTRGGWEKAEPLQIVS